MKTTLTSESEGIKVFEVEKVINSTCISCGKYFQNNERNSVFCSNKCVWHWLHFNIHNLFENGFIRLKKEQLAIGTDLDIEKKIDLAFQRFTFDFTNFIYKGLNKGEMDRFKVQAQVNWLKELVQFTGSNYWSKGLYSNPWTLNLLTLGFFEQELLEPQKFALILDDFNEKKGGKWL